MVSAWAIMISQECEGFNSCTLQWKFTPQLSQQFTVNNGKRTSAHGRELAWGPAQASQPHHTLIHSEYQGHSRRNKEGWEHSVSLPAVKLSFTGSVPALGCSAAQIRRPGILLPPYQSLFGQIWRPNLTLAFLYSVILRAFLLKKRGNDCYKRRDHFGGFSYVT